jgi:methyl-accepting chemotaxis protein
MTPIRPSSDDLAKRTQGQAASVEQTAAALEQITGAVSASSKRAEAVGNLMNGARNNAESGSVVESAIVAMRDIERSSTTISSIIGVIHEIAFQPIYLPLMQASRLLGQGRRERALRLLLRKFAN